MKLFSSPKSFFEVMTLVIYINYAVGLRVFEYPRGHPRSVLSLIYFLIMFVIYCGGTFGLRKHFAYTTPLKLDFFIYVIMIYIYMTNVILKMTMGWWHSKEVAICYKKILEIDKTLRQLGLAVNYDGIYFMMIGVLIVWFLLIMMTITGFFSYFQTRTSTLYIIYMILAAIMAMTIDYIIDFEFYVLSKCLEMKFGLINRLLRETVRNLSMQKTKLNTFELEDYAEIMDFEQQKNIPTIKIAHIWNQRINFAPNFVFKKQSLFTSQIKTHISFPLNKELQNKCWIQSHSNISTIEYKSYLHLLQILRQVHLEMCKVTKLICSAFGIQIAWEVALIIMCIIHNLYNFYSRTIIQVIKLTKEEIYMPIVLNLINIIKIFLLSRACKNAADEGNKTVELIHITYGSNTDIDTQDEMQQFGIQIVQSPVIFYVFGLRIDNHILSMILKSVTIYMVIMVQVSSALESNSAVPNIRF